MIPAARALRRASNYVGTPRARRCWRCAHERGGEWAEPHYFELGRTASKGPGGPFEAPAAIQACHDRAPTLGDYDKRVQIGRQMPRYSSGAYGFMS